MLCFSMQPFESINLRKAKKIINNKNEIMLCMQLQSIATHRKKPFGK